MGMTSEEFHMEGRHQVEQHLNEMRHIRERRAINAAHHNEMMELLDRLQALKMEYKKLGDAYDAAAAARDAAFAIIKEHEAEMGISAEYVNARIEEFKAARKAKLAADA